MKCYAFGVRVNFNELRESLLALLETGQDPLASRTIQHVMNDVHNQSVWLELREVLQETVGLTRLRQEPWVIQYAQVLRGCRDIRKILEVSERSRNPLVRLERAWALVIDADFVAAEAILREIIPGLTDIPLGFAYRCQTSIEFQLGRDWRSTWQHVRSRLSGRALGIALLDESFQYAQIGEEERSRKSALEAAPLLERDPYYSSWAQHSLGISYLRDNLLERAEQALVEAEELSRQRRAQAFRARALCGIGSLRRAQGHLRVAETHYRQAVKSAQESDDLIQALWGIGHCLRLQGNPEKALEQFKRASRVKVAPKNWIEVHRALALLMLERTEEAQRALKHVGEVHGATVHRLQVARAELLRLCGCESDARAALEEISNSLATREEAQLFPALFGLLEGTDGPNRSELAQHLIEVKADFTAIRIDGRTVAINPSVNFSRLLAVLLERGGTLEMEALVQRIWPQASLEQKRKQLWRTVQQLRDALGWRTAVVALQDAYQLDSSARWVLLSEA